MVHIHLASRHGILISLPETICSLVQCFGYFKFWCTIVPVYVDGEIGFIFNNAKSRSWPFQKCIPSLHYFKYYFQVEHKRSRIGPFFGEHLTALNQATPHIDCLNCTTVGIGWKFVSILIQICYLRLLDSSSSCCTFSELSNGIWLAYTYPLIGSG